MAEKQYVTEEQKMYAAILEKGMYVGLLTLLVTFLIYTTGILDPYIPLNRLADYWHMSASQYLHTADIPDGWGWAKMVGYGDFLNFIGIAILAGVTIISYMAIIPTLFRNKDTVYAIIACLEVLVLVAAASGLISTGGH